MIKVSMKALLIGLVMVSANAFAVEDEDGGVVVGRKTVAQSAKDCCNGASALGDTLAGCNDWAVAKLNALGYNVEQSTPKTDQAPAP